LIVPFLIGIKNTKVAHLYCPQYETLSLKKIHGFIENFEQCYDYYPASKIEIDRLPKQFVINVAYTVLGEPFNEWVK
jgi:hypothetical protein